ncbi:MAG: protein kinase [Muribaculaceae bacterium]|nr:protein kinase [Muribaculaceae bacterium]
MESGFISEDFEGHGSEEEATFHHVTGRFEFEKIRSFGALYFVKRPSAAYRNDLLSIESLRKEYEIGRRLNHPSIVKYIKMEDDSIFEEYIDGLSIREMIERKDIRIRTPEFIEKVCRQLLEATAYMHSQRIVHNDIKPENIMITRIGDQLKLVDLGCATTDMWDVAEGYTPAYRAPEQGVAPTNIHTDIFLVGKLMEELTPLAGVGSKWEGFIKRATFKVPKFRYTTDEDALKAIPKNRMWSQLGCMFIMVLLTLISGIKFYDFLKWLITKIFF